MFAKKSLLGTSALAVACMAGSASTAQAVATPVKPEPIVIVVSAPTTKIDLDVTSTARWHSVRLMDDAGVVMAQGSSRKRALRIHGSVPSSRLRRGCDVWRLRDGDGSRHLIDVCVVDRVILTLTDATRIDGGYTVRGTAIVYSGGRYVPFNGLQVNIQEWRAGRWVSVGFVISDSRGVVTTTVGYTGDGVRVRLSTPRRATTGGSSSAEKTVG